MSDKDLNRREFVKTSGTMLIGVLAASSGALSVLAPSKTWALELTTLNGKEGKAILRVTRHILPHQTLDDAVYALVVKDLDAAAAGDEAVAKMLREGVSALNGKANGDWLALSTDKQFDVVKAVAGTDFFEKIRSTAIVSLYNNEMAWAHFGYEGPSWPKGGYLNRGFQDLKWLPNPPADASPAPA